MRAGAEKVPCPLFMNQINTIGSKQIQATRGQNMLLHCLISWKVVAAVVAVAEVAEVAEVNLR